MSPSPAKNKSPDKISEVQVEQGHDDEEDVNPIPPFIKPSHVPLDDLKDNNDHATKPNGPKRSTQDDAKNNIEPAPHVTKPNGPKRSTQDDAKNNIEPAPRVTKPNGPKHSSFQDDINGDIGPGIIEPVPRIIKPNGPKRSFSGSKSITPHSYGPPIVERDVYERRTIERWFVDPEGKPLMQPYIVEKKYKEMHREQKEEADEKREQ